MDRYHLNRVYEPSMTKVAYLTEVYGNKPVVTIDCPGFKKGESFQIRTCYGAVIAVCNALEDYANALDGGIVDWELKGFKAAVYELHAARLRGISRQFAQAIGYDYLKTMADCEKKRKKKRRDDDVGEEALALLSKKTKEKQQTVGKEEGDDGKD